MATDESLHSQYFLYLLDLEHKFRSQIKSTYPLFREIPIEWKLVDKLDKHTYIVVDSSIEKGIYIELERNPKKLNKAIKNLSKYFNIDFDELNDSYYLYHLFISFYKMIEAPFSKKDRKKLHLSMYKAIKNVNQELYEYEAIQALEYIHMLIKEFISLNRLVNENEENNWFHPEIIALNYYLALESTMATVNSITIIWYLNTILYCPEKSLNLIEKKFMDEVFSVGARTVKRILNKKDNVHLPNRLNDYYNDNKKLYREKNIYKKLLLNQFQGYDRYESVQRLVEVISPYIDYDFFVDIYSASLGKDSIYFDLFETFSLQDQALFIKNIFDEGKLLKSENASQEGFSIEYHLTHEFYKKNRPMLVLLGDEGYNQNLFQKGNYRIKLKHINLYNLQEVSKLDLAKVSDFQRTYGLPVLIPLNHGKFYYYEYEMKFEEKRKVKYRRISRFFKLPDILEIYLDNTGSMFFEEDKDYRGFNDGSRRDISISVVYAFIMGLYNASLKQNKKCKVRLHSFSEKQVSTDLIPIEDFVHGSDDVLKVLYNPENGYNYENLNIIDDSKTQNQRRVIIIITDGDLVLEGRTEREAIKMKNLARIPNTQIILFEMEQQFSLGRAVKNDPLVVQYSVKNKDLMFKQGIEIILANTSK